MAWGGLSCVYTSSPSFHPNSLCRQGSLLHGIADWVADILTGGGCGGNGIGGSGGHGGDGGGGGGSMSLKCYGSVEVTSTSGLHGPRTFLGASKFQKCRLP